MYVHFSNNSIKHKGLAHLERVTTYGIYFPKYIYVYIADIFKYVYGSDNENMP